MQKGFWGNEETRSQSQLRIERVVDGGESKPGELPYNCEAILKEADSPVDRSSPEKLYHQLYNGVSLQHKRKKYWVDKKTHSNCFMLFARDLSITWAENDRYWKWQSLNEPPSDVLIDVLELIDVCWLEVNGKFHTKNLSPGTLYEVVFVVKLKDPAYGWHVPVNFSLVLPNGKKQERQELMMMQLRHRWLEIPAGEFRASPENVGEIEFSMNEHETGEWKKGLLVKGVAIRPKA